MRIIEGTPEELLNYEQLRGNDKPRTALPTKSSSAAVKPKGIPVTCPPHYKPVFETIREYGPTHYGEIAGYLDLDPQYVSNIIQRLKAKRLVVKVDHKSLWELTPEAASGERYPAYT